MRRDGRPNSTERAVLRVLYGASRLEGQPRLRRDEIAAVLRLTYGEAWLSRRNPRYAMAQCVGADLVSSRWRPPWGLDFEITARGRQAMGSANELRR